MPPKFDALVEEWKKQQEADRKKIVELLKRIVRKQ